MPKCSFYDQKIWVNEKSGYRNYSISMGNKREDGTWANAYLKVRFRKDLNADELLNQEVLDLHGFMTVNEYDTKDGVHHVDPMLMVMDYSRKTSKPKADAKEKYEVPDDFATAEEDIPF